jgi:L-threonylcarbamoyladenylate synthase
LQTELLDAKFRAEPERPPDSDERYASAIARAAALLQAGRLVAFPTDTVYGVAAVAVQPGAVARLYVAKARPPEKAIPILISDVAELQVVAAEISPLIRAFISQFWPGGLTLILKKSPDVPPEVSRSAKVAVRLPDSRIARDIIRSVGKPLAVTSANRSGQPSPCTAEQVMAQLNGRIAAIVDGGACPGGVPSTIVDCTTLPPKLLRAGAISAERLLQISPLS